MFAELLQSSYFALFVIIALGFLLGRVKIKGLSLDISAVIFVALAFGHFGVVIPKEFGDLGLVLFIFTIGIQAGPGFFSSFRSKGKVLIILTAIIIGSAALTAVAMKYLFHLDTPSIVGLLAGALTSTPGLAVAIDSTGSSLASIAYGIAYPFGVIGVILFVKLLPKLFRVDLNKEAERIEKERTGKYPELGTCTFKVTNRMVFGRTLAQLSIRAVTGAVISRIKSGERILMPYAGYVVKEGDVLQAVGTEESLSQLSMLIGERSSGELPLTKQQSVESILVSRKDMVGKNLGSLNLQQNFGCTVTRVRRSGIDITPSPDLALKFGDKLTVVGETEGIKGVSNLFGNNQKVLSDTDFLPRRNQLLARTYRRRTSHRARTQCGRQDRPHTLDPLRLCEPTPQTDRTAAVPRRGRHLGRTEPRRHVPGKRLVDVHSRRLDNARAAHRRLADRNLLLQGVHARPARYAHRRYDEHPGPCGG